MRPVRYYLLQSKEGNEFYATLTVTTHGLLISIFHDEPSKETELEQAQVVVHLETEDDSSEKVTRILARLWDDKTPKEDFSTYILTLAEQQFPNHLMQEDINEGKDIL